MRNIFEFGFKKFLMLLDYVECYVEFLIGVNDVVNVRVLFERFLSELSLMKIWDMFVDFECLYGIVDMILDVEVWCNVVCGVMVIKMNFLNLLLGRYMCMDIRFASEEYCDYFASFGVVVFM